METGLCRDCFTVLPEGARRCSSCGRPRLVFHPEIFSLSIAHLDCDAFYAAIEKRDNPELRDKPLIIGGGKRGVVSTACYIARTKGVGSAMPMFKALAKCPEAVVLSPNMEKYAKAGKEVRQLMRELTPLVEPLSIDEAFLDLTGTERLHKAPPAISMAKLAKRIEAEIGITVSVGLSYNKFLAKIASDLDKPRGFSVIGEAEALDFLAEKPVSLIWGVGKALQAKLERDGITRIKQLRTYEENDLLARYGVMGRRLFRLAHGQDARIVSAEREAKSISSETTFANDISSFAELDKRLWPLCEKLSARMKAAGLAGQTVVLKLKTKDFKTRTRNQRLSDPSQLAEVLYRTASPLLKKECDGKTAFRLLGVGFATLTDGDLADPPDLLDPTAARRAAAERAMDEMRSKFGKGIITMGRGFKAPQRSQGSDGK
ncbi:DNA polymerase IV [Tepidicaulis sp.]|uniref:DNA polymerase IV n=1 Tax=Tepidicaulis sp. TaxID=1920809 RepID=UPI003B5B11FB